MRPREPSALRVNVAPASYLKLAALRWFEVRIGWGKCKRLE